MAEAFRDDCYIAGYSLNHMRAMEEFWNTIVTCMEYQKLTTIFSLLHRNSVFAYHFSLSFLSNINAIPTRSSCSVHCINFNLRGAYLREKFKNMRKNWVGHQRGATHSTTNGRSDFSQAPLGCIRSDAYQFVELDQTRKHPKEFFPILHVLFELLLSYWMFDRRQGAHENTQCWKPNCKFFPRIRLRVMRTF